MNITAYLLLLIAILFGVVGQLLLKYGMSQQLNFRLGDLIALVHNFPVVSGFCFYGVSTLLYFKVLATLDLSVAYPTVSLGYVLVIFISKILFKEAVNSTRWIAVLTICLGVAIVGLGPG